MKCPKCQAELKVEVNPGNSTSEEQDIDFECENGHRFWVNIRRGDLEEEL